MAEAMLPVPWKILGALMLAGLAGRKRSFAQDARACTALLQPAPRVMGNENIPAGGGYLVTVNHYTRPGFGAWWLALAASAMLPTEVCWVVTEAWTFPDGLRAQLLTPLTRWAFRRLAGVYGFISMPPMPPRPQDAAARARAVRQVLQVVRRTPGAVIGLAPEGGDTPGAVLGVPPPGVGRFIQHLAEQGLGILPLGVYEQEGRLYLNIGAQYNLSIPGGLGAKSRDQAMAGQVMCKIAGLLPEGLRGDYGRVQ